MEHVEHALRIAPPVEPDRFAHIVRATVMQGALLTPVPTSAIAVRFLDVQIGDAEGVVLDELAAGFDDVAHQAGENLVGDVGLRDFNPLAND